MIFWGGRGQYLNSFKQNEVFSCLSLKMLLFEYHCIIFFNNNKKETHKVWPKQAVLFDPQAHPTPALTNTPFLRALIG